jgi:ABC-type antimicrobial peptide transport system permease subunit
VNDELRVDKFFEKDKLLFQVMQNLLTEKGTETIDATPGILGESLAEEFPEVVYSVTVVPSKFNASKGVVKVGDKTLKSNGQYVTKDFLNVFSYKLLYGDKSKSLSSKNSIVISDELAVKLFKNIETAIGKTVEWSAQNIIGLCTISGVFESPPANATTQFDLLLSYELYKEYNPSEGWRDNSPHTYVLLKDGASLNELDAKVKGFIKSKDKQANETLFLQKYSDRYLYGKYENGMPSGGRIEYVRLFSLIAFFILVIACINFMNLFTAKASQRIKEVGIKKAIGAKRNMLVLQYLA